MYSYSPIGKVDFLIRDFTFIPPSPSIFLDLPKALQQCYLYVARDCSISRKECKTWPENETGLSFKRPFFTSFEASIIDVHIYLFPKFPSLANPFEYNLNLKKFYRVWKFTSRVDFKKLFDWLSEIKFGKYLNSIHF